jgi:type II secretory pathway predicted ATPase ExeA
VSIAREGNENARTTAAARRPHFFAGAAHGEALARLEHLVESGLRCGLVVGPRGTGKSTVLDVFAEACRAVGCEAVSIDVTGLDELQFLERLAQRLEVTSRARGRAVALWSEVIDALTGRALADLACVVIVDHLDRAAGGCQHLVRRLVARGARDQAETWIVGFSGRVFPVLERMWREENELRIELAPLTEPECHAFLESLLEFLGRPSHTFESVADALVAASAGVPAELRRLSELSLLLADEPAGRVSPKAVAAVLEELRGLRFSA